MYFLLAVWSREDIFNFSSSQERLPLIKNKTKRMLHNTFKNKMLTFVFAKDQHLTAIFMTDSTFSMMYLCPFNVSWKRMSFAYEENSFSEPVPVNTGPCMGGYIKSTKKEKNDVVREMPTDWGEEHISIMFIFLLL